jgi:uncharacterized protein (DUF169 family)
LVFVEKRGNVELVQRFQNRFGSRWVKVNFYRRVPPDPESRSFSGERFCEAVTESYGSPLILTAQNVTCPGAQYVFGWNGDIGSDMVKNFHEELGFPLQQAEAIVNQLPKLKPGYAAVGLNQKGDPDVLVCYCQPEQTMEIVKVYQQRIRENLMARISSVVSICGNIALATFLDKGVNLSFGCRNARKYGRIGRDRLAVGISSKLARLLVE